MKTRGDDADRSNITSRTELIQSMPEPDPIWRAHVAECLRANQARRLVLHAPREHRLSRLAGAIEQTHRLNKSVLILAGEIAKAEWLRRQLSSLTRTPITILKPSSHSAARMPPQRSSPTIVIGTRSAIFAPLRSVGLIWVEGEENPAFKEPQEPRYHAREVACMRAEDERALLVLASEHPSLESRMDAGAETYTVQPNAVCRPALDLIDLHDEPAGTLFSGRLIAAMREAMERKTGIVLFLNRKGFAGALVCRDCGGVPRCTSCAVALTYYREAGRLMCRYCGMKVPLPDSCPTCRAARLSPIGEGTERADIEVRRLFPHAKVARLDGDTLRRSSSAHRLWEGVASGVWDILIGTKVLFQREPIPRRGLVGILQADSGLHLPDFRAAERTYQLLIDAVNSARPASEGGRVVLQTWLPAHHAVQAVVSGEPNRFYDEELAARRLLSYPPACHLASLSVSGKESRVVETAAKEWKRALEHLPDGQDALMVLGPVSTTGGRLNGRHRYQILVKGADRPLLCRLVHQSVQKMEHAYRTGGIKFVVDMDPVEMS
jgi:primosomal protein N' (replication factor Y)